MFQLPPSVPSPGTQRNLSAPAHAPASGPPSGLGPPGAAPYQLPHPHLRPLPSLANVSHNNTSLSTGFAYVPRLVLGDDQQQQQVGRDASNRNGTTSSSNGSPARDDGVDQQGARKKQKRNKPTLSCSECVERKTKCNRGRPTCLACVKRHTECRYTQVAEFLVNNETGQAGAQNVRGINKPKKPKVSTGSQASIVASPVRANVRRPRSMSRSSIGSSHFLLSNVPFSKPSPSNVFGIGGEHPFANYWTCQGGLPEVIGVLPTKEQADILIAKYFEVVDPVYPMIQRRTFYRDYDRFWSLSEQDKCKVDAAIIALHFVMYAMGTQFVELPSPSERALSAEFYVSACHQSLRIAKYLSRPSIRTMQAMVLVAYFLMNDNHASDAWAFAGILTRQAYAMGLNRDPEVIIPEASMSEKQQRRKLWQAVLFQDTFLTVLLKLPPTTTHSDVSVDSLADDDGEDLEDPFHDPQPTPISVTSIANLINPEPKADSLRTDLAYIRANWAMANLVQETISSRRALGLPVSDTARQKTQLLTSYRSFYRSLPPHLNGWDNASLHNTAKTNKRIVRQTLFITSNYFHCLMVLNVDENEEAKVTCNIRGALEAAHEAINAFFLLVEIFESEAKVWWVFQHRAFEEAMTMARLLSSPFSPNPFSASLPTIATCSSTTTGGENHTIAATTNNGNNSDRSVFAKAKSDVQRMLRVLDRWNDSGRDGDRDAKADEMLQRRVEALRTAHQGITV